MLIIFPLFRDKNPNLKFSSYRHSYWLAAKQVKDSEIDFSGPSASNRLFNDLQTPGSVPIRLIFHFESQHNNP